MNTHKLLTPKNEQTTAITYSYGRPLATGIFVISLAFGGFGAWAAIAPLDSAVVAPGVVKFESSRKTVQHLDGGIVKAIHIHEGEHIRQGQLLIELEDTEARATTTLVRGQIEAAQAREARLMAELRTASTIIFPEELTVRSDNPRIAQLLADEKMIFSEKRESIMGQVHILEQEIGQHEQEILGLERQLNSTQRQLALLQSELVELKKLQQKGFHPKTNILAQEREVAQLEGAIGAHLADIASIRKEIGEAQLQIVQLEQQRQEQVSTELRQVREQLDSLRERLTIAEDVLRRTKLHAPTDGIVHGLNVYTIGGVISTGQPLMEIAPFGDALIVEARVAPTDIDNISGGEAAEIRFPAFKQRTTPALLGNVLAVSADSFTEANSHTAYYTARIRVADDQLALLGENTLQAGMPAEVFIKTGSRTLLEYMWAPLADVLSRALKED